MTDYAEEEDLKVPPLELGLYEHYKGNKYEVVGVGLNTETGDPVVIYKPVKDITVKFWVRPYAMFIDTVMIDGKETQRFKKL